MKITTKTITYHFENEAELISEIQKQNDLGYQVIAKSKISTWSSNHFSITITYNEKGQNRLPVDFNKRKTNGKEIICRVPSMD